MLKAMIQEQNLGDLAAHMHVDEVPLAQHPYSNTRRTSSSPETVDVDDESMELASPQVQDTILSVNGLFLTADPHTIPLPPSPSPTNTSFEPLSTPVGSSSMQRVEALQHALSTTRREVDEREVIIGVLRRDIIAIQMALPNNDLIDSNEASATDEASDHSGVPEQGSLIGNEMQSVPDA